jgi:hypothetical protein
VRSRDPNTQQDILCLDEMEWRQPAVQSSGCRLDVASFLLPVCSLPSSAVAAAALSPSCSEMRELQHNIRDLHNANAVSIDTTRATAESAYRRGGVGLGGGGGGGFTPSRLEGAMAPFKGPRRLGARRERPRSDPRSRPLGFRRTRNQGPGGVLGVAEGGGRSQPPPCGFGRRQLPM